MSLLTLLAAALVTSSTADLKGSSCDVTVRSESGREGSVSSPGYPGPYPPRSECRYTFLGRGKERVQITFTDFSLHHSSNHHHSDQHDPSAECEGMDSVAAYVQLEGRLEKIDSYCGSTLPRAIMSPGPTLHLEFKAASHSSRHSRGFKAEYNFTENFGIKTGEQLNEYNCGFKYSSEGSNWGTFSSPNFPGLYPRDTECHYFFHGVNHQRVRIHFNYFDVEGVLPCDAVSASDYVEFSNFMALDRKYRRHCGQLKPFDVESDRKFFRVTFRSNDRLDATGFNASYRFLPEDEALAIPPSTLPPVPDCSQCNTISGMLIWLTFMVVITRMYKVE